MGIETIMLTGDNKKTADAIAKQAGISRVIAEVLPQNKAEVIQQLQKEGKKIAMVGDGINDAPALAQADVGIAVGSGTDVAIESANIVLMHNSLMDVPIAMQLSKNTLRNIKQNLFWAFGYNTAGIPLAAGLFYAFGGPLLNPMFAAAAMSLSSVSVLLNALRLKIIPLQTSKKQTTIKEIKSNKKKENTMKTILKVEGMSCQHCENRVKTTVAEIAGVKSVEVNLAEKTVAIEHEESVTVETLSSCINEQGYNVIG